VRFAAKNDLQNFRKSRGKFRGKQISGLPRNFAATLPQSFPRHCRDFFHNIAASISTTFSGSFFGSITAKFSIEFTANFPRVCRWHIRKYCSNNFCTLPGVLPLTLLQFSRDYCCTFAARFPRFLPRYFLVLYRELCLTFAAHLPHCCREICANLLPIFRVFAASLPHVSWDFAACLL
jgi:hypothetical protein